MLEDKLNETAMALATKVYEQVAKDKQNTNPEAEATNTSNDKKDNVKDAEYEEK
jgi:hypothetical protein